MQHKRSSRSVGQRSTGTSISFPSAVQRILGLRLSRLDFQGPTETGESPLSLQKRSIGQDNVWSRSLKEDFRSRSTIRVCLRGTFFEERSFHTTIVRRKKEEGRRRRLKRERKDDLEKGKRQLREKGSIAPWMRTGRRRVGKKK